MTEDMNEVVSKLSTGIGDAAARANEIRAEIENLALPSEMGDEAATERRNKLRGELVEVQERIADRTAALAQARYLADLQNKAAWAEATAVNQEAIAKLQEQREAAAGRLDHAIAVLAAAMAEVEEMGEMARQMGAVRVWNDRTWPHVVANLVQYPVVHGAVPKWSMLPDEYMQGFVPVRPVSHLVRGWSVSHAANDAAQSTASSWHDPQGMRVFSLERGGAWYAQEGWAGDRSRALRWNTEEDAETGLAELRKQYPGTMGGEITVTSYAWNPTAGTAAEATPGTPVFAGEAA